MNWLQRLFRLKKKTVPVRTGTPGKISPSRTPPRGISQPSSAQPAMSKQPAPQRATYQPPPSQAAMSQQPIPQSGISQQPAPQTGSSQSFAPQGGALQSPVDAAQGYIEATRKKMNQLTTDFAAGMINRTQFQVLYSHYQTEISQVESMVATQPEAWEKASTKGESVLLRKRYIARAQAYAIYNNANGLPLGILGSFRLDPALVIPMLSAYRSATHEIFGSSLRLSQHEDGQWLCFVSGKFTTLLAVFTDEPISKQLQYLNELHQHFERANEPFLMQHPIDVNKLIYPHEYFLGKWQR